MSASTRYLISAGLGLALLAGCEIVDERDATTSTIRVTVVEPAELGSATERLSDEARTVTAELEAYDDLGRLDTGFDHEVDVRVHYLGSLSATGVTAQLEEGRGTVSIELPAVLGATFLWVEDTLDAEATSATGASDTLWFREPLLEDVSTPDLGRPSTWLRQSRFEGKQVRVEASKHGGGGHLIVTGVYAQGYTVSDVDCSVSPCVADPFSHLYVFTFGRPRDENFDPIEIGHRVVWVSGGVSEFNGLTELNFPQTALLQAGGDAAPPDESLLPAPVVIEAGWLQQPLEPDGMFRLEALESGLVAVEGGVMCPLDDDYDEFKQWKLDVGLGCGAAMNVISAGAVSDFDPVNVAPGTALPRVVGTLKGVNFASFNVWIVQPRRSGDIEL